MNRPNRGPSNHSNMHPRAMPVNSNVPMTIAELRPNMRGFNLECVLLEKAAESRRAPPDDQLITTFLAADKSGSIILTIWGSESQLLRSGDLIRLQGGEAKLFKGHIQLSTTKSGKYKKFGEDTIPFTDKPNWSEFDWVQDPNRPNMMLPLTPQLKMSMSANGIQPIPAGPNMQQQRHSQQAAINPAFQRPNQRPGNMAGSIPGQRPAPGQGQAPGQGGFPSNINKNFGGGPGQQQHPQHNMNGPMNNGPPTGPSNIGQPHRSHSHPHVHAQNQTNPNQYPNPQNQGPNQGYNNNGPPGNTIPSNGHSSAPPPLNGRPRFNKKMHRDLDAPDSYPSPRSGLTSSVDEFAREMKFAQGGGGPGHIRKKTRTDME
ncbi:hypothetical protein BGX28_003659 [Mortierella sp. GBA30]|nr:hypothetical protein BGX28_003659 [Mortierella sp. GBA30]